MYLFLKYIFVVEKADNVFLKFRILNFPPLVKFDYQTGS